MVIIDNRFLDELGLSSIPQSEKDLMIADIQETLADRIGAAAEAVLSEPKLDELDRISTSTGANQAAITSWLQANLPNYQQIIDYEIAKIKEEIKPQVANIVASFH